VSAWAPPLRMFIIGVGSVNERPSVPEPLPCSEAVPAYRNAMCRYRGTPLDRASARAAAIDTPRSAFAPSRLLVAVPSSAINASSSARWVSNWRPTIVAAISPLMLATAFRTPLPPYRAGSPSRSSSASRSPVDAPDGTAARPATASTLSSTSTVGFPRESRISRPCTRVIFKRPPPMKCNHEISKTRKTGLLFFVFSWLRVCRSSPRTPSIGLRFELERVLAQRSDERLIVWCHDDDAGVGDGVAPAIFFHVVTDQGASRNQHVAIDNRASNPRVPADADARHEDALFDLGEAVHAYIRAEHAAVDGAARYDAPRGND